MVSTTFADQAAAQTRYLVTKQFTTGVLKGMTLTENTGVRFDVGFVCKPWAYGNGYVVLACVEVGQ